MGTEDRNKVLVERFFAAMNAGDSSTIVAAYAEDGSVWTSGGTLISGTFSKAQIREASGRIFEAFPHGILFSILAMTAEGERVAVEAARDADHDEAIKRENTEFMAGAIPNAGLLLQPEVSHFSMLQAPQQFTDDVKRFLDRKWD